MSYAEFIFDKSVVLQSVMLSFDTFRAFQSIFIDNLMVRRTFFQMFFGKVESKLYLFTHF